MSDDRNQTGDDAGRPLQDGPAADDAAPDAGFTGADESTGAGESTGTPPDAPAARAAPPPPRRGGRGLAFFAVLLALGALAGGGYLWLEQTEMQTRQAALERQLAGLDPAQQDAARDAFREDVSARFDELRDGLAGRVEELSDELAGRVDAVADDNEDLRAQRDELADTVSTLRTRLTDLDGTLKRMRDEMAGWPVRFRELQDDISSIRGVDDDARQRWLRAEAEYFINVANAELQLAADPQRAARALRLADERLRQMAEPALNRVREAIAGELNALDAVPTVDREGLSLRLATLAGRVEQFALPDAAPSAYAGEAAPAESPDDAEPGLHRAWLSLRRALSEMVSVRRDGDTVSPQISSQDAFILRRNLELQIESARLALLQRETGLYRDHLEAAREWLERWFDTDDDDVAGASRTLAELAELEIAPPMPQLDRSLQRLREYARERESGR